MRANTHTYTIRARITILTSRSEFCTVQTLTDAREFGSLLEIIGEFGANARSLLESLAARNYANLRGGPNVAPTGCMHSIFNRWFRMVLAERENMAARTQPLEASAALDPKGAQEAIYRAAADLLQWQRATGNVPGKGKPPPPPPISLAVSEDGGYELRCSEDAALLLSTLLFDLGRHGGTASGRRGKLQITMHMDVGTPGKAPQEQPHAPIDSLLNKR